MEITIRNDLKKVLLAGIGLTAMTVDKADSFVKELVEKGRLTVEEGKELEQELKRQSKEEAQELLNKLDAKKSSVEYATKDDVKRLEEKQLPTDIDYKTISGLRLEAQEKLNKYRPLNIGQAGRISGVNPADVSVLLIWLSGRKHGEN